MPLATATVDDSGRFLGMRFPTYAPHADPVGGRRVYLIAGYSSKTGSKALPALMQEQSMQPLDKLLNEYVLWWPGVISANQTTSFHNFIGNQTNPTHTLRQIARGLNKDILQGHLPPPGLDTLATVMQFFDPDW